jgi:cytochrome c5
MNSHVIRSVMPFIVALLGCAFLGVVLVNESERLPTVTQISYNDQLRTELADEAAMIATINAAPDRPIIAQPVAVSAEAIAALPYSAESITAGQTVYASLCSACHGADAGGMPNLGKPLNNSEFARGLSDQDLLSFVKTGRPIWDTANTTGIDMPPRGGNPALTDDDILNVIAYLRTLDPLYVPPAEVASKEQPEAAAPVIVEAPAETSVVEVVAETSEPEPQAAAEAASTGIDGQTTFMTYCSSCHGGDARGLPNLGKNLVESEFVHSLTPDDLLVFIKTGRPMWDTANTTGVDMPPKGGNPALTDEEILAIIGYILSLQ